MALGTVGIYKIQSLVAPEKMYIGSSINIERRWKEHICRLKENTHGNRYLQTHYNNYGLNDLVFSVLCLSDKQSLLVDEQRYIDEYNPQFNICKIVGSRVGVTVSLHTRLKQSQSAKKRPKISAKTREKLSSMRKGNKHRLGTKQSASAIEKTRQAQEVKVVNSITGEVIRSLKVAAKSINMPYRTFCNQLGGVSPNKTIFRLWH